MLGSLATTNTSTATTTTIATTTTASTVDTASLIDTNRSSTPTPTSPISTTATTTDPPNVVMSGTSHAARNIGVDALDPGSTDARRKDYLNRTRRSGDRARTLTGLPRRSERLGVSAGTRNRPFRRCYDHRPLVTQLCHGHADRCRSDSAPHQYTRPLPEESDHHEDPNCSYHHRLCRRHRRSRRHRRWPCLSQGWRHREVGQLHWQHRLQVQGPAPGLDLGYEFEVDSNRNGQTWNVRITDNAAVVFKGARKTVAPSGSFTVKGRTANRSGQDTFVAKASNTSTGETCTARITA